MIRAMTRPREDLRRGRLRRDRGGRDDLAARDRAVRLCRTGSSPAGSPMPSPPSCTRPAAPAARRRSASCRRRQSGSGRRRGDVQRGDVVIEERCRTGQGVERLRLLERDVGLGVGGCGRGGQGGMGRLDRHVHDVGRAHLRRLHGGQILNVLRSHPGHARALNDLDVRGDVDQLRVVGPVRLDQGGRQRRGQQHRGGRRVLRGGQCAVRQAEPNHHGRDHDDDETAPPQECEVVTQPR